MKNSVFTWVLVFIVIILGIYSYYNFKKEPQTITETKVEYRDTVIYRDTSYKPDYIKKIEGKIKDMQSGIYRLQNDKHILLKENSKLKELLKGDSITGEIDSIAIANIIFKEYFSTYYYDDILVNDSALYVEVKDSISENMIMWRGWNIKRTYPTKIITNQFEANGLFIGGYIGQDYGVQLQYKYKNNLFGVGGGKGGLFVSYSYKIK